MQDSSKQKSPTEDKTPQKATANKPKKAVAKKSPDKKPTQKSGSTIAWLAIILVFVATGAGYMAFTQLTKQINQFSSNTEAAMHDTSVLSDELQSKTGQINTHVSDLSTQMAQFQQSSDEKITLLQKQVGKNRRQWLIAEAEYLVSVANTRLQLAGDLDTAIIALQAADQRLKENGDPLTFAVREQLAKEINTLKSTTLPDTVGLSSQILALESAVSTMGVSEPHAGTAQAPEIGKGDASPVPENIKETLNDAWENFSKLIVVRRSDRPMAALMTPERVELIRKNLALKLESARLALINQHQTLYTSSIAISKTWLTYYFDINNPAVKTAIEQLNQLEKTVIKAEFPSIALSLKMLRDLPLLTIPEQSQASPTVNPGDTEAITPMETTSVAQTPTEKPVAKENASTTTAPTTENSSTTIAPTSIDVEL